MTAASGTTHPRLRWWERRSPLGLRPLANTLWWIGHGQLFVAVMCAAIGLAGIVALIAALVADSTLTSDHWSWVAVWFMLFAPAFLFSGAALRASSTLIDDRPSALARAASAVGMIAVIALGAFTIVATGAALLFVGWYELTKALS